MVLYNAVARVMHESMGNLPMQVSCTRLKLYTEFYRLIAYTKDMQICMHHAMHRAPEALSHAFDAWSGHGCE